MNDDEYLAKLFHEERIDSLRSAYSDSQADSRSLQSFLADTVQQFRRLLDRGARQLHRQRQRPEQQLATVRVRESPPRSQQVRHKRPTSW